MNKALFLDRDGVINIDHGYTYKISDLNLLEGVVEGLQAISHLDYKIFIITNQSGIARGLFAIDDLHFFMDYLLKTLAKNDINISDYFFCPHHLEGTIKAFTKKCSCRKPEPGMLHDAQKKYNLDLSQSILIGDKETDILAGKNAGVPSNILITDSILSIRSKASYSAKDLIQAAKIINRLNGAVFNS